MTLMTLTLMAPFSSTHADCFVKKKKIAAALPRESHLYFFLLNLLPFLGKKDINFYIERRRVSVIIIVIKTAAFAARRERKGVIDDFI